MRRRTAVLAAALTAGLLAGCAPSNPEAIEAQPITDERRNDPVVPTGPGGEISIEAGDLFFENLTGEAIDGEVVVNLDNIGDALHNFRIDQAAGDNVKVEAAGGEQVTGTLQLFGAPGGQTYTYYCDIPGHRSAGMEGEIIVYATEEGAAEGPLVPEDMDA
jgi:plastocyanin